MKHKDDVLAALAHLGVKKAGLESAEAPFRDFFARIHVLHVIQAARKAPEPGKPEQAVLGFENGAAASASLAPAQGASALPAELRKRVKEHGALSDETEDLIKDYEHYLKTGQLRTPDRWFKG